EQTDSVETGSGGLDHRAVDGRRVCVGRGEPERHPLRARHSGHGRDFEKPVRSERHSGGEAALSPSDSRGPEPRHQPPRDGPPDGAGRDRRGRGRTPDRGPHPPRPGAVRRGAEPLSGTIRIVDGRGARHRERHRPPSPGPTPMTILGVIAILAGLAQTPDPFAIVGRAGRVYRNLTSLQADFIQILQDRAQGDTLTGKGVVSQAGNNYFAMRFSDPPNEAIVVDGKYIWTYTPSTAGNQVTRSPVPTDPVYGVNLLAKVL